MSRRERAGVEVAAVRNEGAAVVGIGIGDVTPAAMNTIFGPDGFVMADADDLAEKLVQIYRGQLDR
jgi:nitric oxide reductase activation protein